MTFCVLTFCLHHTGDDGCGDKIDGWYDGLCISVTGNMVGLCWAEKCNSDTIVFGLESFRLFSVQRVESLLCLLSVNNNLGGSLLRSGVTKNISSLLLLYMSLQADFFVRPYK